MDGSFQRSKGAAKNAPAMKECGKARILSYILAHYLSNDKTFWDCMFACASIAVPACVST